jgi:predicted small secreted protein
MKSHARKSILLLVVLMFASGMSACNTMRGVGKDTEEAGEKIQEKADKHDDSRQP